MHAVLSLDMLLALIGIHADLYPIDVFKTLGSELGERLDSGELIVSKAAWDRVKSATKTLEVSKKKYSPQIVKWVEARKFTPNQTSVNAIKDCSSKFPKLYRDNGELRECLALCLSMNIPIIAHSPDFRSKFLQESRNWVKKSPNLKAYSLVEYLRLYPLADLETYATYTPDRI